MQKLRKLRGEDDFDSFSNRFLDNFLCLGLKQAPGKTTCCFYMLLCTMYCVQVTASRKLNKHDQRTTVVQRWKLYQSWREAYVILTFWLVSWIPWIWQSPPFLDANFGKFPLDRNSERLNRLGCNLLLSHYLACAHPHRKMIGTPAGWQPGEVWEDGIEWPNQSESKTPHVMLLFEFTVFLYFFSAFCVFCKLFIPGTC